MDIAIPDEKTGNTINLILINKRWSTSVQQCRPFKSADMDSHHSLVMANIRLQLKTKYNGKYCKKFYCTKLTKETQVKNNYQREVELKLKETNEA